MKKLFETTILGLLFCLFSEPVLGANDLIYSNVNYDPYDLPIGFSEDDEVIDFGSSNGGKVCKFVFQYASNGTFEDVIVRFYKNTSTQSRGTLFKTFWLYLPPTYGHVRTYEYVIPKAQQFVLPAGNFGYSFEFPTSGDYAIMQAWGGQGNVNYIWAQDYWGTWGLYQVDGGYAGFYMQLYLPIDEITCDISGFKFNDLNGNEEWDSGEPAMPGWEVYLDLNNNGQKDAGEPNSVTNDPNGMYVFENLDAPAVYTIREIMKSGWTQTLPGGPDYKYILSAEPNLVYEGYHFGNTDQEVIKYGGGDGSQGDPYRILTADHMNQIGLYQEDWGSHFILVNDIDMSSIPADQYRIIGYHNSSSDYAHFTGVFNGNHHAIQNFQCTTAFDAHYVGLFGYAENAEIYDLTMSQAVVNGGSMVGALVAYQMGGTLTNCHVEADVAGYDFLGGLAGCCQGQMTQCSGTGTVTGGDQSSYLGGLIGWAREATIQNCHTTADVTGGQESDMVGGFVGCNLSGNLSDCYSTGSVSAGDSRICVGGLIGEQSGAGAAVARCYSSSTVTTGSTCMYIGGLIGMFSYGEVTQCYSTGDVTSPASECVGGLLGAIAGDISHCYCTGNVTSPDGSRYLGGFAGIWGGGSIQCCFSTGAVGGEPAGDYRGGFCGFGYGTNNCFWDRQTSGQLFSAGAKGRTTEQMQQVANYINWNKTGQTIWEIQEGTDYPHLIWEGTAGTDLPIHVIADYLEGEGSEQEPFRIQTPEVLNIIGLFPEDFDKEYELTGDIDLSMYEGTELNLIGFYQHPFAGYFHGNDHQIRSFTYMNESHDGMVGLFRIISGTVENLHMEEVMISVTEARWVGGLVGRMESGTLLNCSVSGSVSSGDNSGYVGGLAGSLTGASVIDGCSSRADIAVGEISIDIGGLTGGLFDDSTLSNSFSISSIATGVGADYVGGLAGEIYDVVDSCFSLGSITVGDSCQYLGGLVGYGTSSSEVNYCYSRTSVTTGDKCRYAGGLIGRMTNYVRYCYSAGAVETGLNSSYIGGLIGNASYTSRILYSYWDTQTSGLTQSSGGYPRTTEQMMQQATYASWNFSTIWQICEGMNYPRLQSHPSVPADLFCPDGVGIEDLAALTDEWLAEKQIADMAPDEGDGFVDALDWARLAAAWMTTPASPNWDEVCDIAPDGGDDLVDLLDLTVFADGWLAPSLQFCDIAPAPNGDGRVDLQDFAAFTGYWMQDAGL